MNMNYFKQKVVKSISIQQEEVQVEEKYEIIEEETPELDLEEILDDELIYEE